MSDLSRLATRKLSDEGVWFTPVDLDGNLLDCRFKLLGPDSTKYLALAAARRATLIKALAEMKDAKLAPSKDDDTGDELASLVVDWEGVEWDGVKLAFSFDEVKRVLKEAPFIANQIDKWIGDRRNFIAPGSRS